MLDEFKQIEPQNYNLIINAIKKNKVSHAYIIETDTNTNGYNFAVSFAKAIFCPHHYTNNNQCSNCNQCQIIDDGNYPELTIIKPEGILIKKAQLVELQNEFSKKSVYGNNKVYIIQKADQMNNQSANSILKFLEEPPENVIAILLTTNKEKLLKTIVSRCQLITLKPKKIQNQETCTIDKIKNQIFNKENANEDESINKQIETIINFIIYYENNHKKVLINMNNIFCEQIKDKENLDIAFSIIISFYKDVFNNKLKRNIEIFDDYISDIQEISQTNSMNEIIEKINVVEEYKQHIKYNVNPKLLIDGLIIALEEVKK